MTRTLRIALGIGLGVLLGTLPFLHYRSCAGDHEPGAGGLHATHTH
jgi:hypothetical protein